MIDPSLHVFNLDDKYLAFEPITMHLFQVDSDLPSKLTLSRRTLPDTAYIESSETSKNNEKARNLQIATCKLSAAMQSLSSDRRPQLTTLWLNISHTCNMRCSYCFADGGDYGKASHIMNEETAYQAIRFLFKDSTKGQIFRIVFFGGEPLTNYQVLKNSVLYAESKADVNGVEVSFTLITNGTLINEEIVQFIKSHNFRIQFSLDGPEDINDLNRYFHKGQGSFESAYKGLVLVKNAGITNIAVRPTITHHNCNVTMLHKYMQSIGFKMIAMIPVQADSSSDYHLTKSDLNTIRLHYKKLALDMIASMYAGKATDLGCFSPHVLQLLKGKRKRFYCGAGYNSLCVTPDGSLYPCHRFVSESEFEVGSVDREDFDLKGIGDLSVEDKESCSKCWARYLCGGGCEAAAYAKNNDFHKPDETLCEVTRAIIENALRIFYVIINDEQQN